MGILMGALGGMGAAGQEMFSARMKSDMARDNELAVGKQRSDLELERQRTMEVFKRNANLKAGQEINAAAGKMTADRLGKQIDNLNDPEIGKLSPEDKALLANATPEQQKEVGILGGSRAQKYDDRATAAENLGYLDQAREARGQQQVEITRERNDKIDAHNIRRDENSEARANNTDAYNNKHLDEIIRHNKAVEAAAWARTGAEKLSPAAKVQLEIAGTSLGSAQKQESMAAKELSDAQRSMNPEAIESAKRDWMAAKTGVKMAMDHYTQVGKAHLGADWKEIATPEPAVEPRPTPPQAAIDRLIKNPDKKADFEQLFGAGSADAILKAQPEKPVVQKPAELDAGKLKILSSAGESTFGGKQYNVELPGGKTRVMSRSELEKAGYRFTN